MFRLILSAFIAFTLFSCVPIKKYNELASKEKACSEELETLKKNSLTFESMAKDLQTKYKISSENLKAIIEDTTKMGNNSRVLSREISRLKAELKSTEDSFDKLKNLSAKETAKLYSDLEIKNKELQEKEDALIILENELNIKQNLLKQREERVKELEDIIKRKDMAVQALKDKIAQALRGFENQGLSVEERNGRIYVSLEAKLLFKSGSTVVENEGKNALVQLGKVLENEKELEIVVEGHTDSDKLSSATHPSNNWELSVLRSTSVVEILLSTSEMNPTQIMAAGRGEFYPVDLENKAKNRRIEVIISPNLNELFEIISGE